MAKARLTVRSLINLGLWDDVVAQKEWSPWILNEGRLDYDDWVEFNDEFPEKKKGCGYRVHCGSKRFSILSQNVLSDGDIFTVDNEIYKVEDAGHLSLSVTQIHTCKAERIDHIE